jgi:hypothetical protein
MTTKQEHPVSRRGLLGAAGGLILAPALGSMAAPALAEPASDTIGQKAMLAGGRRKLGALEVSGVGLGVQNMSRTYQTTIPSRPEMLNIIRAAFDRGVTLFDAAEAYGPFEVERILGEGVAPFRDKIVIASKFGWNIDLVTGQRGPGLNSRPDHIKRAVDAMLKRLCTDRVDLLYQHRVDPAVPIEDVAGAIKDLMAQGKVLHWGLCEMGGVYVVYTPTIPRASEAVRKPHAAAILFGKAVGCAQPSALRFPDRSRVGVRRRLRSRAVGVSGAAR